MTFPMHPMLQSPADFIEREQYISPTSSIPAPLQLAVAVWQAKLELRVTYQVVQQSVRFIRVASA